MITFLTISYNQEDLIIEHMESIKYQIENFGKNEEFKYILSDDCSKDNTVNIVKQWIKANSTLFKEVKILTSEENQGVVRNYLRASSHIDTKVFKILAGDDLYYKNNIFEVIENYDVVFSPIITFGEMGIKDTLNVNKLLMYKDLENLKKLFKIYNCFNAPGSFFSKEVVNDKGLRQYLSNFKWIEDAPQWYYLLNNKTDLKIDIKFNPYILYRVSEGISVNKTNSKYDEFFKEQKMMLKKMGFKINKYPKYINPFRYYTKYLSLKLKYFESRFNKDVIEANIVMKSEMRLAPAYLDMIKSKANEFYLTTKK